MTDQNLPAVRGGTDEGEEGASYSEPPPMLRIDQGGGVQVSLEVLKALTPTERILVFTTQAMPDAEPALRAGFFGAVMDAENRKRATTVLGGGGLVLASGGALGVAVLGASFLPIAVPMMVIGPMLAGSALFLSFGEARWLSTFIRGVVDATGQGGGGSAQGGSGAEEN